MSKTIKMAEVAQQAILLNQPKKFFAIQQSINCSDSDSVWLFMIRDLVEGAGYNYSRIAKKVGSCPSTIQKLVTHPGRRPRQSLFEKLLVLYYHVFNGPYLTQRVQSYLQVRPFDALEQIPKDWVKRLVNNSANP